MEENTLSPASVVQLLIDFIQFKLFISPFLWITLYWVCALLMPLIFLLIIRKIRRQMPQNLSDEILSSLPFWKRSATALWLSGLAVFIFSEILWRMAMEFIIAYFQIREALVVSLPG
jgi:hypothetical protein